MNDFELELKNALRRKEPATDFTARVMAAVEPRKVTPMRSRPMRWIPLSVAASLLLGFGAVRIEQHRRAEHAKQQLMLALEITARTIGKVEHVAQEKLTRSELQ